MKIVKQIASTFDRQVVNFLSTCQSSFSQEYPSPVNTFSHQSALFFHDGHPGVGK